MPETIAARGLSFTYRGSARPALDDVGLSVAAGEIIGLLKDFHRTLDQTLLIITHDERIALQADRIIAIEDGRISSDQVIRQ